LRTLHSEHKARERDILGNIEGPRDYAQGYADGLLEAIHTIEISVLEERAIRAKCGVNKWSAADLKKACETALGMLKRADRARAIGVLERILEKVTKG